MKLLTFPTLLIALVLSACGSDVVAVQDPGTVDLTGVPASVTTTEPAQPVDQNPVSDGGPMLVLTESGGCSQVGPLCRTITFWPDGRVETAWLDDADRSSEASIIAADVASSWLEVARSTDFDALVGRLPEGECQGCYDGIDTLLRIDVGGELIILDSMVVEFLADEPLFAATNRLIDAVPYTLGEAPISSDPSEWNIAIEPPLVVDGVASPIDSELAVVAQTGRALGFGLLDAAVNSAVIVDGSLYMEIGRSSGCGTFEHLALTPTNETGVYELFHDTDNMCEAFAMSGFGTPVTDLSPADDGTITIIDARGTTTVVTIT